MRTLAVAACAALMWACGRPRLAHSYQTPSADGVWKGADTLTFALPPAPVSGQYGLHLGMRLGADFPYAGIWTVVEARPADGSFVAIDTIYYRTMDGEGRPLGRGVNLQTREQPAYTLPLARGQAATVRVYHIMHRDALPHVLAVGIRADREY